MHTAECNYDGLDCKDFIEHFPDCDVDEPERVGDGHCDPFPYFSEECGYDGSDCESCDVEFPEWLADGICNGFPYYSKACSFDGTDCDNCAAIAEGLLFVLNDGYCDVEFNNTECGWDGLDCLPEFNDRLYCTVPDKSRLGDGICGMYHDDCTM